MRASHSDDREISTVTLLPAQAFHELVGAPNKAKCCRTSPHVAMLRQGSNVLPIIDNDVKHPNVCAASHNAPKLLAAEHKVVDRYAQAQAFHVVAD